MILIEANLCCMRTIGWHSNRLSLGDDLGLPSSEHKFPHLAKATGDSTGTGGGTAMAQLSHRADRRTGPRHWNILDRLILESKVNGAKISDAVLAALAMEYGAALASTDQDFRRFPTLRWINPLA